MSKVVEIEQKFYCSDKNELVCKLEKEGLKLKSKESELDEYFTDIDSFYIKNRTCLRIRKTNGNKIELTFKGKSKNFGNNYAKVENNIILDSKEYQEIANLLESLGFYSYSVVNKMRYTYSLTKKDMIFNVLIDEIVELGNFVEFELLCNSNFDDIDVLQPKLNQFVNKFSDLNFENANLPYRDFVATKIYNDILPANKLTTVFFDLDGTLIDSEKAFFNSFKNVLQENYGVTISIDDYKKNELEKNAELLKVLRRKKVIPINTKDEDIMNLIYNEYEEQFKKIILENESIINFELVKKLKSEGINLGLVSTSKRKFIDVLLKDLNIHNLFDVIIAREDVENLKPSPEAYLKALDLFNVEATNCIAIENSKRGITAATNAHIKTIKVSQFNIIKENRDEVLEIDSVRRLLLILINNIGS